jgi:lysophospholipid acyltransferase (LPLAT)-like uncharacterized protein
MSLLRRASYALGAPVVAGLLKTLWGTYRFTVLGEKGPREFAETGSPLILTLWHDSVFVCAWYLNRLGGLGVRPTYLVSPSMDGEFAVRLLSRIEGHVVRGSATRSGVKAMHGLYRAMARDNASPVILPDGPKGPRHHCKPGSLLLAQLSSAPVLPIACAARWAWRLPTWDRQLVPKPFSRVVIVLGEPYNVPSGLDESRLEEERGGLEQRLLELATRAEGYLRGEPRR